LIVNLTARPKSIAIVRPTWGEVDARSRRANGDEPTAYSVDKRETMVFSGSPHIESDPMKENRRLRVFPLSLSLCTCAPTGHYVPEWAMVRFF
jgi:hypothetical protein